MRDVNERWSLNFSRSEQQDGSDIRNVNFSWENQSLEECKANLNAFLAAAGIRLKVVDAK